MIHAKMASDLRALGIRPDDTILMHSSLSSLGWVDGGAETVIDTLLDVLSDGTLLVPALSFSSVTPENPHFSAKETKSCVGAISEYFRKRPGVMRSTSMPQASIARAMPSSAVIAAFTADSGSVEQRA